MTLLIASDPGEEVSCKEHDAILIGLAFVQVCRELGKDPFASLSMIRDAETEFTRIAGRAPGEIYPEGSRERYCRMV